MTAQIAVRPPGRTLPEDFLHQDWAKQGREAPPCLREHRTQCVALLVDLNGDGTDEVVLKAPYRADVFRHTPAGWELIGGLSGTFCADSYKIFRSESFQAAAPEWQDLVVGGQRYRVNPARSCK
jgi:hypothetical protein